MKLGSTYPPVLNTVNEVELSTPIMAVYLFLMATGQVLFCISTSVLCVYSNPECLYQAVALWGSPTKRDNIDS